jgi:hypothetical protein
MGLEETVTETQTVASSSLSFRPDLSRQNETGAACFLSTCGKGVRSPMGRDLSLLIQ